MTENVLARIFEHNNWANDQIVRACSTLTDEQLDAEPQSSTKGSIRDTLIHLVSSQQGYLALLTLPVEARQKRGELSFDELQESITRSGKGLLTLIEEDKIPRTRLQTTDGYYVEPWVVIVQIINHATEHREQIKSMLNAHGITPPEIDGWEHGLATNTLVPISS